MSQEVFAALNAALARGEVVLSDRFLLANVVYQGHAGGLDPAALWQVGEFSTGGLEPDLTLILDLPVATTRSLDAYKISTVVDGEATS